MDYIAYGRTYFNTTGLFVTVIRGRETCYSALGELIGYLSASPWSELPLDVSPCFCGLSPNCYYGLVHVKGTEWVFVLGPVFTVPLTDEVINQTMDELHIPHQYRNSFYEALCQTPITSPGQLAKHLSLLHLTLTGEEITAGVLYLDSKVALPENPDINQRINTLENENLHNSYVYEVTMYQMVREGSTEQLNRFFRENEHIRLNEGTMAFSPLRHAKNVFITAVARTSFIGAIPGGLDMEKAYQLMDDYIRRCEQLETVEDVTRLQYAMVVDFCRRTGEAKRPDNISTDVWQCMNYIRSHVYHPITLADLAADLGRSTSYVRKHFQHDVGMTVGEFITHSKLEEAKTLLIYSNKSLAEISFDLCFSSQSYFQRLFKKAYGITPAQHRKQGRTI